jgi:hypothetical protein
MAGTGLTRATHLSRLNTTGFQGVSYNRHLRKYEASYTLRGKKAYLGVFDDVLDAGVAASDYRLAHAEEILEASIEARLSHSEATRRQRAAQTSEERKEQARRGRRTTREQKELPAC